MLRERYGFLVMSERAFGGSENSYGFESVNPKLTRTLLLSQSYWLLLLLYLSLTLHQPQSRIFDDLNSRDKYSKSNESNCFYSCNKINRSKTQAFILTFFLKNNRSTDKQFANYQPRRLEPRLRLDQEYPLENRAIKGPTLQSLRFLVETLEWVFDRMERKCFERNPRGTLSGRRWYEYDRHEWIVREELREWFW